MYINDINSIKSKNNKNLIMSNSVLLFVFDYNFFSIWKHIIIV